MDVEQIAQVEVTSEDPAAPIETVFHFGRGPGWRAAKSGTQRIQLIFDQPQHLGAYGCDLLKLRPSARRNLVSRLMRVNTCIALAVGRSQVYDCERCFNPSGLLTTRLKVREAPGEPKLVTGKTRTFTARWHLCIKVYVG